jgi:hypothetical protein
MTEAWFGVLFFTEQEVFCHSGVKYFVFEV